jgi:hypothetical protein
MDHEASLSALAAALLFLPALSAGAADVRTADGLLASTRPGASWALDQVALDGKVLPRVTLGLLVRTPQTDVDAEAGFAVTGSWASHPGYLELRGEVTAAGTADCVADLVVRVEGCTLPLGRMEEEPLLLPRSLAGKLPLVSLRCGGEDHLALAVPPEALAVYAVREARGGVELRFPFGFTAAGPEALRMRASFVVIAYRTEPAWHFRSALERYYAFFPASFAVRAQAFGGWFFAAPTTDLPNPQHFYYHEGGPGGLEEDDARGLGTFPYRESSSFTVTLPGTALPKSYDEAMQQLEALEREQVPRRWETMHHAELDTETRHSGERSLRVRSEIAGQWLGARQARLFQTPVTEPFTIRGWSRSEGVTGSPDNDYSIYVDVCYADGSYLFGQCARFPTGTHDWVLAELLVTPVKPVSELRVYALFRGDHTGTAWFDDLSIGPVANPEANWLENPGFEQLSSRADLGYLRANVCHNAQDQMIVAITDNLSADVGPSAPMNLLRFTLNVDPDLPERDGQPTVAATEMRTFDTLFRDFPSLEGAYIDSVSAWCSLVLNTRRDQWLANDVPFTYDPGTRRVAAAGLFGTRDYLAALQRRYHPADKLIFTNIHCSREAFPLYLVSDVPGIESSHYRSEDDLFFYRACSYRKPLLLMNFMNLHGLDQRALAEDFHRNAAFWGEIPSTGRFVQRAYAEYGDVTHAHLPTIRELAAAGWQPVPRCSGARAERFGGGQSVFFAVRRQSGGASTLTIEGDALAGVGAEPVAMDPVWLAQRPLRRTAAGFQVDLADAPLELAVVRISARQALPGWLLGRSQEHLAAAARVRGKASALPEIGAARALLSEVAGTELTLARIDRACQAIGQAMVACPSATDDLFALSQRRELLQARQALEALALVLAGVAEVGFEGDRSAHAGVEMVLRPALPSGVVGVRLLGVSRAEGRPVVPDLEPKAPAASVGEQFRAPAPGVYTVRAVFEGALPEMAPFRFERVTCQQVLPGAVLTLRALGLGAAGHGFHAEIADAIPGDLTVRARAEPPVDGIPGPLSLAPEQRAIAVTIPAAFDGMLRRVLAEVLDGQGTVLASAAASYLDEPPVPTVGRCAVSAVQTDSDYSGYTPDVLTDGVTATEGLHWTRRAWASADTREPHWLSLEMPTPQRLSGMLIYWNVEDGQAHASRRYRVLVQTAAGPRVVASVDDRRPRSCDRHTWEPTEATAVRLEQEANGGPEHRPGILWLREVVVLETP